MRRNKNKLKTSILTTIVVILGLGVVGMTGKILDNEFGWIQKTQDYFKKTDKSEEIIPVEKPIGVLVEERPDGMSATKYDKFDGNLKFENALDDTTHEVGFVGNSVRWYKTPVNRLGNATYSEQILLGFNDTTIQNRVEDEFYKNEDETLNDYKYVSVLKSTSWFEFDGLFDIYINSTTNNVDALETTSLSFFYKKVDSDKWEFLVTDTYVSFAEYLEENDVFQFAIALRTNNKATNAYLHFTID